MTGKVVAWHTPDEKYTGLADKLKKQLSDVGQDYIMYTVAKKADESWTELITRTKTTIWRRAAFDVEFGTPLLFLDVDCDIHGPIEPLFKELENADIGLSMFHKAGNALNKGSFYFSSRALLVNYTPAAMDFMAKWEDVSRGARNEEGTLKTVLGSQDFDASIRKIPEKYAAKELRWAPKGAVITHTSAHKDDLPVIKRAEQKLRAAYRSIIPSRKLGVLNA